MELRVYPPFELQADQAALSVLANGLTGYAIDRDDRGVVPFVSLVWLQDHNGQIWAVTVAAHDLEFKFEVFGLEMLTHEALQARVDAWTPPFTQEEAPDELWQAIAARPKVTIPAPQFEAWPFRRWQTYVLRRLDSLGRGVCAIPVERPYELPPEAEAACETATGLLLIGDDGRRLLIAANEQMPLSLLVTQNDAEIDEYVVDHEAVPLADYAQRLGYGQ